MAESLLTLILGLAVLAAVYGVGRWAVSMENREHQRRLLNRVYYPKRGRKAGLPVAVRRQGQPRDSGHAPPDD
ncbi:MAG: hypothetical protein OXC69_01665 [Candidatus Tectomicrobia bacterium]|nr:hypothetical protein [Candidatus Tectomicrobia bacterium]